MAIKDVAEMAGVSIATVSRCLNNPNMVKPKTLEKVENAIETLNYQPNTFAQNFRRGKSGLIVVVLYDIGDPLYKNFIQSLIQKAQLKNYDVLIKETSYETPPLKVYKDMLNSKQVDGLIVMVDLPNENDTLIKELKNLPIIYFKGMPQEADLKQCISIEDYQGAQSAISHLLELGHKSIACFSPIEDTTSHYHRSQGFNDCLKEKGLTNSHVLKVQDDTDSLSIAIDSLLNEHPEITGIFCTDDDLAIEILTLLRKKNIKVPEDMSVVGFNNIRYCSTTSPALTTVELPLTAIAEYAFKMLYQILEEENTTHAKKAVFSHRLIVRDSTGKVPNRMSK